MASIKETARSVANFITHPRRTLREWDSQFDKMMLQILSGGSACEPGMKLPMTEINPETNKRKTEGR